VDQRRNLPAVKLRARDGALDDTLGRVRGVGDVAFDLLPLIRSVRNENGVGSLSQSVPSLSSAHPDAAESQSSVVSPQPRLPPTDSPTPAPVAHHFARNCEYFHLHALNR
jgi:hypothetical protein